jgi:hypothetical protein
VRGFARSPFTRRLRLVLTLGQLYAVALAAGVCAVFFDVSKQSYVPSVLDPEDLTEGFGKLGASASFAEVSGRGLASGLVAVIGAALAVTADALSYAASVTCLVDFSRTRRSDVMRRLTAWICPSDGEASPVPNSALRKGRSAAACRVTLMACARNQGASTGAFFGAAATSRGGSCGGAVPGSMPSLAIISNTWIGWCAGMADAAMNASRTYFC